MLTTTVEATLRSWGAAEIFCVTKAMNPCRGVQCWVAKLADGYHYVHSDGGSIWAAKREPAVAAAPNAEAAWWAHELIVAQSTLDTRRRDLEAAIEAERAAFDLYAKALLK